MADHPRSSEQQEADVAASKGCGMFDFLKKKPEDVHSSENAGVTKEPKEEEKPSLAERLHLSDSSVSLIIYILLFLSKTLMDEKC